MSNALDTFERLLAQGKDSALLRFSLGNELIKAGRFDEAINHLRSALAQDAHYSAAWKLLGKAQAEAGQNLNALETYRQGIAAAEARGDIQAAKEMGVFARRIEKQLSSSQ
jgi:predicted Zn-dependent protease